MHPQSHSKQFIVLSSVIIGVCFIYSRLHSTSQLVNLNPVIPLSHQRPSPTVRNIPQDLVNIVPNKSNNTSPSTFLILHSILCHCQAQPTEPTRVYHYCSYIVCFLSQSIIIYTSSYLVHLYQYIYPTFSLSK